MSGIFNDQFDPHGAHLGHNHDPDRSVMDHSLHVLQPLLIMGVFLLLIGIVVVGVFPELLSS